MRDMPERRLVALPCKLSPGMGSGERLFTVPLADGKSYQGIAPRGRPDRKRRGVGCDRHRSGAVPAALLTPAMIQSLHGLEQPAPSLPPSTRMAVFAAIL